MKKYLLLFLLLLPLLANAQSPIKVAGRIMNSITKEGIDSTEVRLYAPDTVQVLSADTACLEIVKEELRTGYFVVRPDKKNGAPFQLQAPQSGAFVLGIFAPKCAPVFMNISLNEEKVRRGTIDLGTIRIVPIKEKEIGGAEVRASKLKVVYKGDTIVYNAEAFNLEQNDRLRALVERLPGVTFEDGVILVNGRRVDNMLLSGKDFFQGDIDKMLDNLPAYIVSKVKVYEKSGERSELTGTDMHDKEYVMDVHMKRDYHGVWMFQGEASGGTDNTYGLVAALSRYDDRQMLSINADINNLNAERTTRISLDNPVGERRYRRVNLSYYIEPSNKIRFTADADYRHRNIFELQKNNSSTYLSDGSVLMARSVSDRRQSTTDVDAKTSLRWKPQPRQSHTLSYQFTFGENRQKNRLASASFYANDATRMTDTEVDTLVASPTYQDSLLNSLRQNILNSSYTRRHKAEWESSFAFQSNILSVKASFADNNNTIRSLEDYRLAYRIENETDTRLKYIREKNERKDAFGSVSYTWKYVQTKQHDGQVMPFVNYSFDTGDGAHPLYRLERLADVAEWDGTFGIIPDDQALSLARETAQSYYTDTRNHATNAGLTLSHNITTAKDRYLSIKATTALRYDNKHLRYERGDVPYIVDRHAAFFVPQLDLTFCPKPGDQSGRVSRWTFSYQGAPSLPSLTDLLPIVDDTDPLNVFQGNANGLRNIFRHNTELAYAYTWQKTRTSVNTSLKWQQLRGDVRMQSVYNPLTGVKTYTPVNVPHSSSIRGKIGFSSPLDKAQKFTLQANFVTDYAQYPYLSFQTGEAPGDKKIRSLQYAPSVTLYASISKVDLSLMYQLVLDNISRPDEPTERYRTNTLTAFLAASLPWKLRFDTSLMLMKRAGFATSDLNKCYPFWNAQLSRPILKGKATVKLKAYNILAQNANISSTFDGITRTEAHYNSRSRYILASFSWNLSFSRKKK